MIRAPVRYQDDPGNPDLVYDALCKVLSGRGDRVDWGAFTPADWHLLPHMASLERVDPMVYWQFKDGNWPPGIPLQEAARLMQAYDKNFRANDRRFEDLRRVLAVFNQAAIPVILIKGAHLSQTIYPNIGLRCMSDLDLLVPQDNLEDALSLVNQLGYEECLPLEVVPGMNQKIGRHYHLENELGASLDLHWSLVAGGDDWRKPPDDWAWSQAEKIVDWNETDAQSLALNLLANLLYLAAHISLEHGIAVTPLRWFFDIHLLILEAGTQLDWDSLLQKSQEIGWSYALGSALTKVQACFDTVIPEAVLNALLQPVDKKRTSFVIHKSVQSTTLTFLDRVLHSLAPYSVPMKIQIIFSRLFPSAAFIRHRYQPQPDWLWPLYYPYRLWKIPQKILSSLYHRLINRNPS